MSKHGIIIICCSMSAIWLASTSTHCLRPTTFDITAAVTQLSVVSSKTKNAQKLISDNLFGHRASDGSGMWLYKSPGNEYVKLKHRNKDVNISKTVALNLKCN
jgi:hypothetical protein